MKKIWVITLFPDMVENMLLENGVVGTHLKNNEILNIINPRDYCKDKHKSVDDSPYGGGPGMVLKADVLENTLKEGVTSKIGNESFNVIYTAPRGKNWNNTIAKDMSKELISKSHLVFICGRYEGIDERFISQYVDNVFSIGDFVLSGGEFAVGVIIDSLMRFVPGVLGNTESSETDSFEEGQFIEHPQFTRPKAFNGEEVPEILLSGNHKKIEDYRKSESLRLTKEKNRN